MARRTKKALKKGTKAFLVILCIAVPAYVIPAAIFGEFLFSPPRVANHDFTAISMIDKISKFRSCQGHEYGSRESFEPTSSMKHYYEVLRPLYNNTDNIIPVYACFDGTIFSITDEVRGDRLVILGPQGVQAIYFHIGLFPNVTTNVRVTSGDHLGYANVTSPDPLYSSNFDIAFKAGLFFQRYYSYFDVMTDEVFLVYQTHGIATREMMSYTREYREQNNCQCGAPDPQYPQDCVFSVMPPEDWVTLT
jgi:hypothetical protein